MKLNSCLPVLVAVLATVPFARAAFAEAPATDAHTPTTSMDSRADVDDASSDGQAIPVGFHEEKQTRKGMIYAGAFTFGVPYTLSVVLGAALLARHDVDPSFHSWWLLVPAAGPFALLPATKHAGDFTLFLTDGMAQAVGIALIVSSFIWPRRVLVRNGSTDVAITPMRLGTDGNGIGLVGRF